jgi:phosphoenolpyruvate synthase/pyruvate phosphate dikinase
VLFTADPISGHRRVSSVEAVPGLGEALVSGQANPDVYTVRDNEIVARKIAARAPAMTDAQIAELVRLGRRMEAHFGRPQDIEWCLVEGRFAFVQSRPITTLFPIPEADDGANHLYVSVGHQQMMTDAMKPLGLSVWQLIALIEMHAAGGRLFVDVAPRVASPTARAGLLEVMGSGDPLIGDALRTVLERDDFIPLLPDEGLGGRPPGGPPPSGPPPIETDPAIVTALIECSRESVAALRRDIQQTSGAALLDFIRSDISALRLSLREPQSVQAIMAGIEATRWLNDHLEQWLGETNAADTLTQSVPNNITSEMGLALLDVADVIRPYREVVTFLRDAEDDGFLEELSGLAGGHEARDAIVAFLDTYGVRCVGEIDITRPRWSERPSMLLPIILGNIENFAPSAGKHRFERGLREAREREQELLARLRALPDGASKAQETKQMIDRLRTFMGYREYPKYGIVSRLFVYKQALMVEAARLVQAGVLDERDDIFYLTFQELDDVVRSGQLDRSLLDERKETFASDEALAPPRVLTSDGEAVNGSHRRDGGPSGALVGLPVSAGVVEGRARVVLDVARADLQPGDILVTRFTDPSWATVFLAIAALVTEVGGVMTHGAVIAREYGLPAIVGVQNATELIRDGQRIRVSGTDGYIELLDA